MISAKSKNMIFSSMISAKKEKISATIKADIVDLHIHQFVDVWSSIPDHIKEAVNLKTFKRMLSNHFLDNY